MAILFIKKSLITYLLIMTGFVSWAQAPSITWQTCLGGSNEDWANSVNQTADGGYIVAGYSYSNDGNVTSNHGGRDYWVVKLNAYGSLVWQRSFGGSYDDVAYSALQTTDGGYIVAGQSGSNDGDVSGNHGGYDYWVVKLNDTGSIQWQKCYGGGGEDDAYSIQQTTDGGYIVAGYSLSSDGDVTGNHGNGDYWVVKLDVSGSMQWEKCYGGSSYERARAVRQTNDGGYIVVGTGSSPDGDVGGTHGLGVYNYWVVKLSNIGALQWHKAYGGTVEDDAYDIRQTYDGGYVIIGYTYSNDGDVSGNHSNHADYWVVKINDTGVVEWQKCLGGTGQDWAYAGNQTPDSSYVIAGVTESNDGDVSVHYDGLQDYWVAKISSQGVLQWQKPLGGSGVDEANSITTTSDGGYVVAGFTNSNDFDVSGNHGNYDYWVVKLGGYLSTPLILPLVPCITLYPNPNLGSFTLNISSPTTEDATIIITNMLGEKIKEYTTTTNQQTQIQLSAPPGIYFITAITNSQTTTSKIVVQ